MIEQLESRRLLAAALAPPSIGGLRIRLTITDGSAPFADSGQYTFRPSSSTNQYDGEGLTDNIGDLSGTYTYQRSSGSRASVRFEDDFVGGGYTSTLTFTARTSGTFELKTDAGSGFQRGSFVLYGSETFGSLNANAGVLTINGTGYDDELQLSISGNQTQVMRNNWTSTFSSSVINVIHVFTGNGADVFSADGYSTPPIYVDGGLGNDLLIGGDGKDTLTGGAGKNTLAGSSGDDRLNGSGGRDFLYGGNGSDRLYGNGGDDVMEGGGGVDRLFGGDGNDLLLGGGSADKLYGEAGNDTLRGGAGADLVDGGSGTDWRENDASDIVSSIEHIL